MRMHDGFVARNQELTTRKKTALKTSIRRRFTVQPISDGVDESCDQRFLLCLDKASGVPNTAIVEIYGKERSLETSSSSAGGNS